MAIKHSKVAASPNYPLLDHNDWNASHTLEDGTIEQVHLSSTLQSALSLTGLVLSKTIMVESPTASENLSFFFTNESLVVTQMRAVVVGATPSVTWTLRHDTDRSAAGTEIVTGGTTTTSTTFGSNITNFDDATISDNSFIWLETTAKSGTVTQIEITLYANRV